MRRRKGSEVFPLVHRRAKKEKGGNHRCYGMKSHINISNTLERARETLKINNRQTYNKRKLWRAVTASSCFLRTKRN